jgi:hypothetical protein
MHRHRIQCGCLPVAPCGGDWHLRLFDACVPYAISYYRFVTSWSPGSAIPLVTPLLDRLTTADEICGDGDRHHVWQRADTGVPDVRISSSRTVSHGLFPGRARVVRTRLTCAKSSSNTWSRHSTSPSACQDSGAPCAASFAGGIAAPRAGWGVVHPPDWRADRLHRTTRRRQVDNGQDARGRLARGLAVLAFAVSTLDIAWSGPRVALLVFAMARAECARSRPHDSAGDERVLDHRKPGGQERVHVRRRDEERVSAEYLPPVVLVTCSSS